MKETFAEIVSEVEKAVRPLGFRVESASQKPESVFSGKTGEECELRITVLRKRPETELSMDGMSESFKAASL